MSAHDRTEILPPRQQAAVRCFLAGGTASEAATAAQVTERTLRRWLGLPAFQGALREAGRESAREATSLLLSAQQDAVRTLRAALTAPSAATRVRAARAILELGIKASSDDVEQRLTSLEEGIASWQQNEVSGTAWTRWSA